MNKIYLSDDDNLICDSIKTYLEKCGYKVKTFSNGFELLEIFKKEKCDLIITDISMPKMSGYDLCREIRKISMLPIFMISAHNDEIDRVLGLELGSDDYISKPISFRELEVRIRNSLRRQTVQKIDTNIIQCDDLVINIEKRCVYINNEPLSLTTKEYELLYFFATHKNNAFSREQLIERVWGYDYIGDSRQVDQMIKRIRKKMLLLDSCCKIDTVWGYGYKMVEKNET